MRDYRIITPFLALVSGLVFPLALPNELLAFGSPLLGAIALAPLYVAVVLETRPRAAVGAGMLFGATSTIISNYWLANFGEFSLWTVGGVVSVYVIFNAVLAWVLWRVTRGERWTRPILFAVAWTAYELLKSIGYLGYPWGLAAYPFATVPVLIQIADITGVYGISFLAVYANAVVGETVIHFATGAFGRPRFPLATHSFCLVGLVLFTLSYGMVQLNHKPERLDEIRLILVQQNSDAWVSGNEVETLSALQDLSREALSLGETDVLVWSETSLRLPYEQHRNTYYATNPPGDTFNAFLAELDVPLVTGAPYVRDIQRDQRWNAAILLDNAGDTLARYGKQQLVPFVEHVPFWSLAPVRNIYRDVLGMQAVWSQGDELTLFELPGRNGPVLAATPICFEDAFAGITRRLSREGAQLFINLTNNGWSRTNSAQTQHLTAARFRPIETRTTLVRSTNTGVTAVIDPWGRTIEELPMFEAAYLRTTVPIYRWSGVPTVYSRVGDLFGYLMLIGTVVALVATIRTGRHGFPAATTAHGQKTEKVEASITVRESRPVTYALP